MLRNNRSRTRTPALSGIRTAIILFTIAINILAVAAFAFVPGSNWRTAVALNVIDNALLIGYAILWRDKLMAKLVVFGLLIGFIELLTDAWIVNVTRSLDYSVGGGWTLWRSPAWMPFAWEVVAVQFGYIGMRLIKRFGTLPGMFLTGLLGAINIPYYEEMARRIHWWRYHDTAMFPHTHTPWAIIIGEFLIAGYFAWFAGWTRKPGMIPTIAAGVLAGLSMFVGYALPYWIILRLR